jgi:uncharacterized protein
MTLRWMRIDRADGGRDKVEAFWQICNQSPRTIEYQSMSDTLPGHPAPNEKSSRSAMRWLAVLAAAAFAAAIWWMGFAKVNRPPEELVAGAGPVGSDAFVYMSEVADVLKRDNARLRLKVVATRDPSENISLLNAGKISLAVVRADTPLSGDSRMVAALYPDYFQLIVAGESKAYDINDLTGMNIAIPEFGTDAQLSFFAVADHYDLQTNMVNWQAASFIQARKGLISGRYDGLFTVRSLRDPQLLTMFEDAQLKHKSLRFLPIRQAEAMGLKRPFLKFGRIPFGAYTGAGPVPTADLPTAYVERVLVTRSTVSAAAIHDLTAALFDRRLELTLRFPLAAAVSQPDLERNLSVPVHDGAMQYYDREKPSILETYSNQLGLLVTLLAAAGSGLLALRSRFMSKQKDRADVYNYKLLDLLDQSKTAGDTQSLRMLRGQHEDILKSVVIALDSDRVTDEGFQSFSLLWESVRASLADRQASLNLDAKQAKPRKS